jgi:hypothetical protein
MRTRVVLALACLCAAGVARAEVSLGLEATVGAQRLGLTRAPGIDRPLAPMGDLGATLLLGAGPLALGVAAEGDLAGSEVKRYNASLLGGLTFGFLRLFRLEVLGEVGAANLRARSDAADAARGDGAWARFHGVRPGLSVKLPAFPLRVGLWGLARWGLVPGADSPAYGLLGRIGLEL